MYCKNCGAQLPNESKFCPSCGSAQEENQNESIQNTQGEMPLMQEPILRNEANPLPNITAGEPSIEKPIPNQVNSMDSFKKNPKKKILIIGGIVFVVVLLLIIVLFSKILGGNKSIYGTWDCGATNPIRVEIAKNNDFKMYIRDNKEMMNIEGTYTTEEKTKETGKAYELTMKASKRVVNGKTYTESYTTKYELTVDKENSDSLSMVNTVSYSTYQCTRVK